MKPVHSVQHRKGWCATKANRPFPDTVNHVDTLCGYVVTLPMGS